MERLQRELFEAAASGSVSSLQQLLIDDPLLLDRATPNYNSETALHVSALLGHLDFVKEIIGIKPELTNELNSQQSSPLHLASVKGHVNVVRQLLSVVGHETMCLARDKDGLTPLHLAARKGRVEVMELLLGAQPDTARLTLYGGETILHLCVKNWQVEALKQLVSSVRDPEFVKCKDGEGNTLLHLAVEYKQVETINLLVNNGEVDVHAVNHKGLTAMDVLIRSRSDVRDSEIRESLNRTAGGAVGASTADNRIDEHPLGSLLKRVLDSENAIMVMASVVAAMAFQIAVSPPGGVWQDDNYLFDKYGNTVDPLGNKISHAVDSQNRTVLYRPHQAGYSILATNDPIVLSAVFFPSNVAFHSSVSIIFLVVLGNRNTKGWLYSFWLITLSMLALAMIMVTYSFALLSWMPHSMSFYVFFVVLAYWFIFYLIFGYKAVKLLNSRIRSRRESTAASSAVPETNTSTSTGTVV